MLIFHRDRSGLSGRTVCPPEHLEGYRRIGESVYTAEVELSGTTSPRIRSILAAARSLQTIADALLTEAFTISGGEKRPIAAVTHKQAEAWYNRIPRLLAAARKEAAFAGASGAGIPVRSVYLLETPSACPADHLKSLAKTARELHERVKPKIDLARFESDRHRVAILRYEDGRTRHEEADAVMRALHSTATLPAELHEKAVRSYGVALTSYLLIAQWLEDPALQTATGPAGSPPSADVWRSTSDRARRQIRQSGEWRKAEEALRAFWAGRSTAQEEREFASTVRRLLSERRIREAGYWHDPPFQSAYTVLRDPVVILGETIPQGQSFLWMYGETAEAGRLVVRTSLQPAPSRRYDTPGRAPGD
ncbi:MAG: hypothetical protein ACYCVB_12220 [Bacilli bacterium]